MGETGDGRHGDRRRETRERGRQRDGKQETRDGRRETETEDVIRLDGRREDRKAEKRETRGDAETGDAERRETRDATDVLTAAGRYRCRIGSDWEETPAGTTNGQEQTQDTGVGGVHRCGNWTVGHGPGPDRRVNRRLMAV